MMMQEPYLYLETVMGEIKIRGLSLAQEKAATLLAIGKNMSDKSVAETCGIQVSMLATWKKDPKFKVRVLQLFDMNVDFERTYRTKKITRILKPIYKEIRSRLADPEFFENTSFKELLRMMSQLHAELRVDGAVDKRFIADGLKQYGNENKEDDDDMELYDGGIPELGDEMATMSSAYEQERARAVGKKVVNIR